MIPHVLAEAAFRLQRSILQAEEPKSFQLGVRSQTSKHHWFHVKVHAYFAQHVALINLIELYTIARRSPTRRIGALMSVRVGYLDQGTREQRTSRLRFVNRL